MELRRRVWGSAVGGFLLASAAGLAVAASSAGAQKATSASFMLDFAYYGGHAPFALAEQRGYYTKNDLSVKLEPGHSSTTTIQAVQAGQATFGFASSLQLAEMKAADPSLNVKVIAQVNQTAPWYIAYVKGKGINSIKDLAGKSWAGTPGGPPGEFFKAFMNLKHMKIGKFIGSTAFDQALLAGQVDMIADSVTAYPYLQMAAQPRKIQTGYFVLSEYAPQLQSYSWALVARGDTIQKNPDEVRQFVDATLHGWRDAVVNPRAAVAAFHKLSPTEPSNVASAEFKYMALLVKSGPACRHGMGWNDAATWQKTTSIVSKYLGGKTQPKARGLYTNAYLPSKPYMPVGC